MKIREMKKEDAKEVSELIKYSWDHDKYPKEWKQYQIDFAVLASENQNILTGFVGIEDNKLI